MKQKLAFWIPSALLSLMMLFSSYAYLANPELKAAFGHLGFPDYFRIELAIAKILGVIALILPGLPGNIREWAYGGFGITFISAFIAHAVNADPVSATVMPVVAFTLLAISYLFRFKK